MWRFGGKQFSAIEKFARRGKQVSRDSIVSAMVKCNIAIISHKSLKCSLEITLGAMRSQYHFAKYENRRRLPCKTCSFPETITHIYNHLLTDCAPSKFLWPFAYLLIIKTTRRRVAITDNLIFFNQLISDEFKVLNKVNRRDIYSIMASFKLILWPVYYAGNLVTRRKILTKLNKNILILKKCVSFKSIKSNIHLINPIISDFSVISYQNLVFQQRNKSRMFVNSLRIQRAEMHLTPNAMSGEEVTGAQAVVPQQTCHNWNQNLIHDVFMKTTIFSQIQGSHLVHGGTQQWHKWTFVQTLMLVMI